MDDKISVQRKLVADLARNFIAGNISWNIFMEGVPETDDELIGEVVDLIEHEPKRGGIFGVNEDGWQDYQAQLLRAIEALEQGA
jgi:hypothetical protein